MTTKEVDGTFKIVVDGTYRYHADGLSKIKLPGNPYMALRIRRAEGDTVRFKEGERIYGES
jgi:hypothetical protein